MFSSNSLVKTMKMIAVALSSQGMQDHFGAKSANFLSGWLAS